MTPSVIGEAMPRFHPNRSCCRTAAGVLLAVALSSLAAAPVHAAPRVSRLAVRTFRCVEAPRAATPAAPEARSRRSLAMTAPCGDRRVPQPIAEYAPKGLPPVTSPRGTTSPAGNTGRPERKISSSTCPSGVQYFYASFAEGWSPVGAPTGATGDLSQDRPAVATCDYHSLAELAAIGTSSSGNDGNIVEVGWTVDRAVNHGSSAPHLFVYHWVNGEVTCYNGCGYVQVDKKIHPGMEVPVTASPQPYALDFHGNRWWVGYEGHWIGYFPEKLWAKAGGFTSLVDADWFGEVAASSTTPCTQMGSGAFGHDTANAAVINDPSASSPTPPVVDVTITNPTDYDLVAGPDAAGHVAIHYGGPGAC